MEPPTAAAVGQSARGTGALSAYYDVLIEMSRFPETPADKWELELRDLL